jgi:hypothetical protein
VKNEKHTSRVAVKGINFRVADQVDKTSLFSFAVTPVRLRGPRGRIPFPPFPSFFEQGRPVHDDGDRRRVFGSGRDVD